MPGLVLNLRPHEKFIVNGVVLKNGAKRSQIRVEDENANVLRVRDAIHPQDVDTPVKRAYYIAQLLISGDITEEDGRDRLDESLSQLSGVFQVGEASERLKKAIDAAGQGRYYSVLCQLKNILPIEQALLSYARIRQEEGSLSQRVA